jgi:hypothetical protein
MRYLVVRSDASGALAEPRASLGEAILHGLQRMNQAQGAYTTSIIDTRSLAIFREFEIAGFAERFRASLPELQAERSGDGTSAPSD